MCIRDRAQRAQGAAAAGVARGRTQRVAGGVARQAEQLVLERHGALPGLFVVGVPGAPAGAVGAVLVAGVFRPQLGDPFGRLPQDGGVERGLGRLGAGGVRHAPAAVSCA